MTQDCTVHISPLMRELLAEHKKKKERERKAAERGDFFAQEDIDSAAVDASSSEEAASHTEASEGAVEAPPEEQPGDAAATDHNAEPVRAAPPFPANRFRLRRHGLRPLEFDGALVFSASTDAGRDRQDALKPGSERRVGHLFELYAVDDGAAVARLVGRVGAGDAERRYEHAARIDSPEGLSNFLAAYQPEQLVVLHDDVWSLDVVEPVETILKGYELAVAAIRDDFDRLKTKLPLGKPH